MEPERPIEKKLRVYALGRRQQQGAPPELHPPGRRLLHAEVAQTYGRDDRRPALPSSMLWPRLAWVSFLIVVVAGGIWVIGTGEKQKHPTGDTSLLLAKKESSQESDVKTDNTAAAPAVAGDISPQTPLDAIPPAEQPAPTAAARESRPMPTLAAPAPAPSRRPQPRIQAQTPAVLASFQVTQQGNNMRIIDADGSIYEGTASRVEPEAAKAQPEATRQLFTRSRPEAGLSTTNKVTAPQPDAAQTYQFQVSGTNITLNQRVVFNGMLTEETAPVRVTSAASVANMFLNVAPVQSNVANVVNQSGTTQRRVSGIATVDGSQQVAVDAIPAQ